MKNKLFFIYFVTSLPYLHTMQLSFKELHTAIKEGNCQTVATLLEVHYNKTNPTAQMKRELTTLTYVAAEGTTAQYPTIIKLLIEYGAETTHDKKTGIGILNFAIAKNNDMAILPLIEAGSTFHHRNTSLPLYSSRRVKRLCLKALFLSGININQFKHLPTILFEDQFLHDIVHGNSAAVERQIANQELDKTDEAGATVLMYAAAQGHVDIVTLLLEKGASPHLQNKYGHTVFDIVGSIIKRCPKEKKENYQLIALFCRDYLATNLDLIRQGTAAQDYYALPSDTVNRICFFVMGTNAYNLLSSLKK